MCLRGFTCHVSFVHIIIIIYKYTLQIKCVELNGEKMCARYMRKPISRAFEHETIAKANEIFTNIILNFIWNDMRENKCRVQHFPEFPSKLMLLSKKLWRGLFHFISWNVCAFEHIICEKRKISIFQLKTTTNNKK